MSKPDPVIAFPAVKGMCIWLAMAGTDVERQSADFNVGNSLAHGGDDQRFFCPYAVLVLKQAVPYGTVASQKRQDPFILHTYGGYQLRTDCPFPWDHDSAAWFDPGLVFRVDNIQRLVMDDAQHRVCPSYHICCHHCLLQPAVLDYISRALPDAGAEKPQASRNHLF